MKHLHFGAGALGRGLVLPRITGAGAEVAVADTDIGLIDHIKGAGGYTLTIADPAGSRQVPIPVARAFAIGRDDAELDAAIAAADFVTTSVQMGNLPRVVARLHPIWQRGDGRPRQLVGAENMRHVGAHIASLFAAEGGLPHGVACPDCVVDRISAALPEGYVAETELYSEWVVEAPVDTGLPGPDFAADVDRLFFRKRYLVNSLADGAAFLGRAKGKTYLHEAMTDGAILATLEPLLDLLRAHLERVYGFGMRELGAYQETSVARLANPNISRRLETVARDPWRKFGPEERFLEPVLAEAGAGNGVDRALGAFMAIAAAAEPDAERRASQLAAIWRGTAAEPLLARLEG